MNERMHTSGSVLKQLCEAYASTPGPDSPLRLDTLRAEQLILQGAPYRKMAQNPVGQVLRGMVRK